MAVHVHEYYDDDGWDNAQYMEWVDDNIGSMIRNNWDLIQKAVVEKFPGASLYKSVDQDVDNISDNRDPYGVDIKVDMLEKRKLSIPVNFDPLEDDEACDDVAEALGQVLGDIKFEKGSGNPYHGSLEYPEISFNEDMLDFGKNELIFPLEFRYTYHYEDCVY